MRECSPSVSVLRPVNFPKLSWEPKAVKVKGIIWWQCRHRQGAPRLPGAFHVRGFYPKEQHLALSGWQPVSVNAAPCSLAWIKHISNGKMAFKSPLFYRTNISLNFFAISHSPMSYCPTARDCDWCDLCTVWIHQRMKCVVRRRGSQPQHQVTRVCQKGVVKWKNTEMRRCGFDVEVGMFSFGLKKKKRIPNFH